MLILRHMAFFATMFLLAATALLEGDVLRRLPPLSAGPFYAALLLNCSLALASNALNMLVTKANGALSLQVRLPQALARGECPNLTILQGPTVASAS